MKSDASPESPLYRLRHSLAHVLAQAVLEVRPGAKLGIGPPIENGFYYDFDLAPPLTPEDLPDLERRMRRIIQDNARFEREDLPAEVVIRRLEEQGAPYKVELAREFQAQGEKTLSVYKSGAFQDLCEGPHVAATGELPLNAFKLDSLAGAYWRGSEKNKMMQRIYGLAFATKAELEQFLARRELAKERDHRRLGQEMSLFTISEVVGKGLPLWMPKGTAIREELERLAKETEFRQGYVRVATPHITKAELYQATGHLPYYAKDMFPPMHAEDGTFYLKPMNCPHHHLIFKAEPRSYRDLPLRLAEYGMCYRYEQSGELSGLLRVRAMAMNDAHIYCAPEQTREEFVQVMRLHEFYYDLLGIEDYWVRLSLPDLQHNDKFVGDPQVWAEAERIILEAMDEVGMPFEAVRGEAAFYGPKIDVQIRNVVGREETASTNQLDLLIPPRLGLTYVDRDNTRRTPHVIHRAPLGTHERFVAFLIEHYGGVFPTWLAPVQVRLIPVAEPFVEYARKLQADLRASLVRAEVDDGTDTLGKKVRGAQTDKVPNLFVVGQKELEGESVAWRRHGAKEQAVLSYSAAKQMLLREIADRLDWRRQPR
ncbi:MAG TPA: threonine--tRNA ligase [bacterium]|nr:threonine--tRNA ligase [bacterium]